MWGGVVVQVHGSAQEQLSGTFAFTLRGAPNEGLGRHWTSTSTE